MRKHLRSLLAVAICAASFGAFADWAYDSSKKTLTHNTSGVVLTNVTASGTDLTIGRQNTGTNFGEINLTESISDGTKTYSIVELSMDAFKNCSNLTGMFIVPDSVTSIGNWSFYATGITNFVGGAGMTGRWDSGETFKNAKSLEILDFRNTTLTYFRMEDGVAKNGSLTKIRAAHFPSTLVELPSPTFNECFTLAEVTGLENLESLGKKAMHKAYPLSELRITGGKLKYFGQTSIGGHGKAYSSDAQNLSVYLSNVPDTIQAAFEETHAQAGPSKTDIDTTNTIVTVYLPYYDGVFEDKEKKSGAETPQPKDGTTSQFAAWALAWQNATGIPGTWELPPSKDSTGRWYNKAGNYQGYLVKLAYYTDPKASNWQASWTNDNGVAEIGYTTVTFSGSAHNPQGGGTYDLQYKVWATGDTEPGEWTVGASGVAVDTSFICQPSDLLEGTTYNYRLIMIPSDGGTYEGFDVSGQFTTLTHLPKVTWGGTAGLVTTGYDSATFAGTIVSVGNYAETVAIERKVWAEGGEEPADWTLLVSGLTSGSVFTNKVDGLESVVTYNYSLRCVTLAETVYATDVQSGTFTTPDVHPEVEWDGTDGICTVNYDFVSLGGTVVSTGAKSDAVKVQYKVWTGSAEPDGWTVLASGLGAGTNFFGTVDGLAKGTSYSYKLRAVTDDDDAYESEVKSGSFTTMGTSGPSSEHENVHEFTDEATDETYWVVDDFERYLRFTVTGYTGTEVLTNFPVLVDVRAKDTNGFSYDDFYLRNGGDIAFVDDEGLIIPHEIEKWNDGGMSLIWVRLPKMTNGTEFTMCYRSPMLAELPDPGNTFEKYIGVWHMNETEDGVTDIKDSTVNGLTAETHAESLAYSNGKIYYARRVAQKSGAASTYGRIIAFDKNDVLKSVGNVFTYSGWYKTYDGAPDYACLVSRKSEDPDTGWAIQYDRNESTKMRVWSGPGLKPGTTDQTHQEFTLGGKYAHTKWKYFTFIFSNQVFKAYIDGVRTQKEDFTLTYPVVNDATATYGNLVIGGMANGYSAFNGYVDEARYSRGVRSADWIKAEYDSMLQVDKAFVTKAKTVGKGPESLVPVVVWEQGKGLPDTIIDVSYAYVQFAGTVTFCGQGADYCRIEYQLWADGEEEPTGWTTLKDNVTEDTYFSIPVFGLKQDMPYNFRIRAVNNVPGQDGKEQATRAHTGSFRTHGNVNETISDTSELLRVDNMFVHKYPAGQEFSFTTPDYVTNIEIMVVGGGGAGGYKMGGGGGGGGLYYSESFLVATSTTYKVYAGFGGKAATNLVEASGNGEYSYFSLASDPENPLVKVPGGGAGGSYIEELGEGKADGASGGGGTIGLAGGAGDGVFGHDGGAGNTSINSLGGNYYKSAAGGGGGAGRAGLKGTGDCPPAGGAGGVGVGCDMTGETLFYGAGGGGGYKLFTGNSNISMPGGGGSGIGGNAADLTNKTPASSGVANTGAGGGGGSMTFGAGDGASEEEKSYWQGGDGGDGVVLIAYEIHGRDPISEDPRVSMTRCTFEQSTMTADIGYRAYWAGTDSDECDLFIVYSTVSNNIDAAVASAEAEWVDAGFRGIGTGSLTLDVPEAGYTYYVRLAARKDGTSMCFSDEIKSFYVPAVELNGVTWKMESVETNDYATVNYSLYETNAVTHLVCYWSENRESLEGDDPPAGEDVYILDFGTGMDKKSSVDVKASEGLERDMVYYFRLAAVSEDGTKHCLSKEIVELSTVDAPSIVLSSTTWSNYLATVQYIMDTSVLDPAQVELKAFYSTVEADVLNDPVTNALVSSWSFGTCDSLAEGVSSTSFFPLYHEQVTNIYVRLALVTNATDIATNGVAVAYSSNNKVVTVTEKLSPTALLFIVKPVAKKGCYGDEPQELTYTLSYGGLTDTNSVGWVNKPKLQGALECAVTKTSDSGTYDITKGTLAFKDAGETYYHAESKTYYYYKLVYVGAKYTVTNAVFSVNFDDKEFTYDGEGHASDIAPADEPVTRNSQPVTYKYRVGTNDWAEASSLGFTNVATYVVQAKATAPNHDEVRGTFKVTIKPAPLWASIEGTNFVYTGEAHALTLVTNVTGLVRGDLNPLVQEYGLEASAWSTVHDATFTDPGEYKYYYRVSAPNHKMYVTNCVVTVAGWDLMVDLDGNGTLAPILVPKPKWIIANNPGKHTEDDFSADPDLRHTVMNEVCPNGLTLWQNYMIGQTNLSHKVVSTVATVDQDGERVKDNSFVIRFANIAPRHDAGFDVFYRLDTKLKGKTDFTKGEETDDYDMNVPLDGDDPTGLYIFNIILRSNITNEQTKALYEGNAIIASCSTVGVMRVSSKLKNTILATPWYDITTAYQTNVNVRARNAVNPNGIADGDTILAYNAAGGNFDGCERKKSAEKKWASLTTVTVEGTKEMDPDSRFELGKAFWLVRGTPTNTVNGVVTNVPIYLIGRYSAESYTNVISGAKISGSTTNAVPSLCANPLPNGVNLNDIVFVGTIGDKDTIEIPNGSGVPLVCKRGTGKKNAGKWGYDTKVKSGWAYKNKFVTDVTIPSGTGFWYIRRTENDLKIDWGKWEAE